MSAERPWGAWFVLDEGHGYKVKRIEVQAGPPALLPDPRAPLRALAGRQRHRDVRHRRRRPRRPVRASTSTSAQGAPHRIGNDGDELARRSSRSSAATTPARTTSCGSRTTTSGARPRVTAPVVVADIVRSGFVEGHHYGSVAGAGCRRQRRLVGRRRRVGRAAALVQQAGAGARRCSGPGSTCPPSCSPSPAPRTPGEDFHVEGARRDPGRRRARRVGAADAARLPARRRRPRGGHPRRRREGAGPDELLRQARRDARHLRRERVGHRRPTASPTTRCRSRSAPRSRR